MVPSNLVSILCRSATPPPCFPCLLIVCILYSSVARLLVATQCASSSLSHVSEITRKSKFSSLLLSTMKSDLFFTDLVFTVPTLTLLVYI